MPTRQPKRILLVEDHPESLELQAFFLRRRGYEVFPVATVVEARHLASQVKPDLIICDLALPDGNGYELMRELHDEFGLLGISLSGADREEGQARRESAGFLRHLVKPISPQDLITAIEAVCH